MLIAMMLLKLKVLWNLMAKLVTYRFLAKDPYYIARVEEGANPYPLQSAGANRYNYKHYLVPKTFDLANDVHQLTALYVKGLAQNADGTIQVAPKATIVKQL